MITPPENLDSFEAFVQIVKALRGPEGCPWDKEQTHRSLVPFAIEESFELAEAIEAGDERETIGELGDVLLQVVLHAEIARQESRYDIHDVLKGISEKMVRRHPHVFSDTKAETSKDVLDNWAKVKAQEKITRGEVKPATAFDVPKSLPALQRSQKIGDKTQKMGFDWPNARGVFEKIDEEMQELKLEFAKLPASEVAGPDLKLKLEHEIGDVLFSVTQLARHLALDAEQALRTTNARFEKRYFTMRLAVEQSGRDWAGLTDADKEASWQQAKRDLAK